MKQAQENLRGIAAQSEEAHNLLENQIRDVEKEIEGQRLLPADTALLRDQLTQKKADRDRLTGERDRSIADRVREFESQRDSFNERIKRYEERGDVETATKYRNELEQLPNPRSRIEAEYANKLDPLEKEISTMQADFDRRLQSAPPMGPAEREKLEARREDLKNRLATSDKDWAERRDAAGKQVEDALGLQSNKAGQVLDQQRRMDEIATELAELGSQRIEDARTDQVRRIASRIYGSKPEDVSLEQAGLISIVWFGSLGMLAALAGPLTAIVALSLQNIASVSEGARKEGKFSRLIRSLLLRWRWRRVRTVKVRVEVPVEKEVEKRVEVPVEKIVKEILYVPLLTDDPEAVRRALSETLEKDVADLVTLSLAGPKHGR